MKQNPQHSRQSLEALYHNPIRNKLAQTHQEIISLYTETCKFILEKRNQFMNDLKKIPLYQLDEYHNLDAFIKECLSKYSQDIKNMLSNMNNDCLRPDSKKQDSASIALNKLSQLSESMLLEADPWEEMSDHEDTNVLKKELLTPKKNIDQPKTENRKKPDVAIDAKSKRDISERGNPCQTPRKTLLFDDDKPRFPTSDIKAKVLVLEEAFSKFNVVKPLELEEKRVPDQDFQLNSPIRDLINHQGKAKTSQKSENQARKMFKLVAVQDGSKCGRLQENPIEQNENRKKPGLLKRSLWQTKTTYESEFLKLKKVKVTETSQFDSQRSLLFSKNKDHPINKRAVCFYRKPDPQPIELIALPKQTIIDEEKSESVDVLSPRSSIHQDCPLKFLAQVSVQPKEFDMFQDFGALSLSPSSQSSEIALQKGWDANSEQAAKQFQQQKRYMRPENVFANGIVGFSLEEIFNRSPGAYRRRDSSTNWSCISSEPRR